MAAKVKHKTASVLLRPTRERTVWMASLHSEGHPNDDAHELMQYVIDKADEQGITLQLDARAYGHLHQMSIGELIVFYESFGFARVPPLGLYLMERSPKNSHEKQLL